MTIGAAARITALVAVLVTGCGTTPTPSITARPTVAPSAPTVTIAPAASADPSWTSVPQDLAAGSTPLAAGTYTSARFRPPITFAVEDGWFAGTVSSGFFDVQQDRGTPDVVAVQFARVAGLLGSTWSDAAPASAADAAAAIRRNAGVVVIEESGSRLGGLEGLNVTIENRGTVTAPVMRVSAGTLAIDPKRRLWISLFDTPDGVLAVMVGGSVATWDHALAVAEPVLESVVIGP